MIPRYTTSQMKKIWGEENKFQKWLEVERAIAKAQAELGIIPKQAYEEIKGARFNIERINEYEKETQHDVIAFLKSVAESMGEYSGYLHFGLTSYDIVDTALALRVKDSCEVLISSLKSLLSVIKELALKYKKTVMMGRTHGVHAQPITFGLKCLSWYSEVERNIERMERVEEMVSYGKVSGAVGTYSETPPEVEERALKDLGLKPEPVSTQIIPRDRYAELLTTLGIIASSFERITTEIRSLQRTEIGEVYEPFLKRQRGSSAMPHKRNPIICERICGLARIVRGNVIASLENVNLWNERDISNSSVERVIIPDSFCLAHYSSEKLKFILENLEVHPERMRENMNLSKGSFFSQGLMLALIKKGMPRDEAYTLVQELSLKSKKNLEELAREDKRVLQYLKDEELKEIFNPDRFLTYVDYIFKKVGL